MRARELFGLVGLLLAFAGCAGAGPPPERARGDIDAVLDGWHGAAAAADLDGYFDPFAAGAVFMGTDPGERWTVAEFRAFVEPYFARGQGWTYVPRDRHVALAADGRTAWVDERLDNEKYGELRGTGVLVFEGDGWKIAHYSMTFPVPNDLTGQLVDLIRAHDARDAGV
jgi:ketosteroid isomerase-like protein